MYVCASCTVSFALFGWSGYVCLLFTHAVFGAIIIHKALSLRKSTKSSVRILKGHWRNLNGFHKIAFAYFGAPDVTKNKSIIYMTLKTISPKLG